MQLQYIKITVAAAWALSAVVIGIAAGVSSPGGLIALASLGLLPPLGVMLLWNEPDQTLSESINQGRR